LRQATRTRPNVEDRAARLGSNLGQYRVGYGAPPAGILTQRHERIHQVVARRDTRKHFSHVAWLLGGARQHSV
jgi:hypothetical protein